MSSSSSSSVQTIKKSLGKCMPLLYFFLLIIIFSFLFDLVK